MNFSARPPIHVRPFANHSPFFSKRKLIILIIGAAMVLRVILGFVNREANDNHVEVVSWIVDQHELPEKGDCWSCYQPKLYYLVCAAAVMIFDLQDVQHRILLMQLVNVFISIFIILLFWMFINKQDLNERKKLLVFAFIAFNPCLAGINVQGTNDTLAIFFGVLAVYAADSFFRSTRFLTAFILIVALIAGALTKASAFVLFACIMIVLSIKFIVEYAQLKKYKTGIYMLALTLTYFIVVPLAGGYYSNYVKYGSFTLSTWEKDPPAHFFRKTPVTRPGVENLFFAFFTFRYWDMVRQPYINNEWNNYPQHRTSLWSQLYGRTLFLHFDQWPPSWQSHHSFIIFIGRILLFLGIIPLAVFLLGLSQILAFPKLRVDWKFLAAPENYFHHLVTLAFLAASVIYSYSYRDFSSMKSIYIFPGLLSFIKVFIEGFRSLNSKIFTSTVETVLAIIVLLSISDIIFLIHQLA